MLIIINKNNIKITGGISFPLDGDNKIVLFQSPNHPPKKLEKVSIYKDFKQYAYEFKNDSYLYIDNTNNIVRFVRDWPGNIPVFYFFSKEKEQFILSDNIHKLVKTLSDPLPSKHGLKLFLKDRKHFHSYTIYDKIHVLHPGLYAEIERKSFNLKNDWWYLPYRQINILEKAEAKRDYLQALDKTIERLIPKDKPAAIMFSGGSDSTLILDRMVKLGYHRIDLFTICVDGEQIQYNYALEKAKIYDKKVIPIYADKENIFEGWKELFKLCYHYLSDLRIDGIFSPSVRVINELKNHYKGEPCTLVWGSQYAIASPVVSTKALFFKFYLIFVLIRLAKIFPFIKGKIYAFALRHLRSGMLTKDFMSKESLIAFTNLYKYSFDKINSPDQLLNLFLSTDYNHLKHWWMDWRNKVSAKFYSNAVNVFPFHDREFQESTLRYSLKVRIGGFKNLFRMPKEYKNLFYSLFEESRVPIKSIKRGNYTALPEFFSLFQNERFYNFIMGQLNKQENLKLVNFLVNECKVKVPLSYDDFLTLDTKQVEQLSGIIFLTIRLKEDGVTFDSL